MMDILVTIFTAFISGVLATAMGALGSVILTALVSIVGVFSIMAGCEYNIIGNICFGMFLGPQVAFGPALCAMNYAWKKGYIQDSKGLAFPLGSLQKTDVLVVGGICAVAGWYINTALGTFLPGLFDCVAATIVILNIVTKIMFENQGLMGKVPEGDKRFGLNSKNKWLPHMTYGHGSMFWLFGGSVGFIAAWLLYQMCRFSEQVGNPMIAGISFVPLWAIAVVFLIFMCCGLPCPVFHHVGLVGAYGAQMAYNAGCSEISVYLWGFAFGIFAHYAGDLLADLFFVYGEGYVDPPSLSMLFCSVFAFAVIPALGLVNPNGLISVIAPITIILAFGIFAFFTEKCKKANVI
ncbi:acetyl-CoA acyltransferase [Enterocloster aldenensis]|uniref:acetyl-CoA acyltransferase n=1 Tax=Enterocloster aldenensis TaxID=358742 RepID=UPI003512BAC5